jgi:hypothetical protein
MALRYRSLTDGSGQQKWESIEASTATVELPVRHAILTMM